MSSHAQVIDFVRSMVKTELAPQVASWEAAGGPPKKALGAWGEVGLWTATWAEDAGGIGMDLAGLADLLREVGGVAPVFGYRMANLAAVGAVFDVEVLDGLAPLSTAFATGAPTDEGRLDAVFVEGADKVVSIGETTAAWDLNASFAGLEGGLGLAGLADGVVDVGENPAAVADGGKAILTRDVAVAATCVGLGEAAVRLAAAYASEREQFGRPIAQFQAVSFMIARAATEVEAAWQLTREAAASSSRQLAQCARSVAADAAVFAADRSLQVHGGYGYTKDYAIERLWRDAQTLRAVDGATAFRAGQAADITRVFEGM